ncbi:MAG: pirin family protein [Spirosomataceae bacterium]|jgi:redox-sensitive bicupin YhaK (pirin superfamily)
MKTRIIKSEERGYANHGWLKSYHTFSFANFYNPAQVNFGALRVFNDDFVAPGMGFGKHPHDNMEIVSIPLEGALEHGDSMGNTTVIRNGEVQIMTAGIGVTHSEKNNSSKDPVKFLQIWVFPNKKDLKPEYDQQFFDISERKNKWQTVVSPIESKDSGVKINQDAWFSLTDLEEGKQLNYEIKKEGNGLWLFVLEGKVSLGEEKLNTRDSMGVWDTKEISIAADQSASLLLIEVPMSFSY